MFLPGIFRSANVLVSSLMKHTITATLSALYEPRSGAECKYDGNKSGAQNKHLTRKSNHECQVKPEGNTDELVTTSPITFPFLPGGGK